MSHLDKSREINQSFQSTDICNSETVNVSLKHCNIPVFFICNSLNVIVTIALTSCTYSSEIYFVMYDGSEGMYYNQRDKAVNS